MRVSVVVPAYNEEKYIKTCLSHLTSQEEPADEIIVVDNNCTDKTVEIAKRFEVRIVSEKKQGMSHARKKGFDEAKSEIIARCDADSKVPPNWVSRIRENFNQEKIIGLTGPTFYYDQNFKIANPMIYFNASRLVLGFKPLFGPNMAVTKEVWNRARNSLCVDDKKVHEDLDLAIHIAPFGKIKFDKQLVVGISSRRVRQRPVSIFLEYPYRWARQIITHKFFLSKAS